MVLLDPRQAKGLEFDTVIVAEPAEFGTSDLYVALTRATQRLGVVHTGPLPEGLRDLTDLSELIGPSERTAPSDLAGLADHEGADASAGTVVSRNSARASSV